MSRTWTLPGSPENRIVRAWRGLTPERRLAAIAAIGLFLTLFLNWYQETVIASGGAPQSPPGTAGARSDLESLTVSLTGWQAFSFVEAAVLLVAAGVLVLLYARAQGRAFHVPGGDGGVITAAGLWTCVLIIWRIFDKEGTTGHLQYATTSGIEWGIFVALAVAALMAYAGSRIRRAREAEPPLPGEPAGRPVAAAAARPRRGPEMDADDTWTVSPRETFTAQVSPSERAVAPRLRRRRTSLDLEEIRELEIAEPPAPQLRRPRADRGGSESS
ncbi:MAG: hypothetical protein ACRDMJ_06390 [Solirubrobacteraceae bacterium]